MSRRDRLRHRVAVLLRLLLLLPPMPGQHIAVRQRPAEDVKRAADGDIHSPATRLAHPLQIVLQSRSTIFGTEHCLRALRTPSNWRRIACDTYSAPISIACLHAGPARIALTPSFLLMAGTACCGRATNQLQAQNGQLACCMVGGHTRERTPPAYVTGSGEASPRSLIRSSSTPSCMPSTSTPCTRNSAQLLAAGTTKHPTSAAQ